MSSQVQVYDREHSFEKNDFEKDFDRLVREYIVDDNLEFSAKQFFVDNAKKGFLIDYVIDNKLPVDITMYVTIKDALSKGKSYLDKVSNNALSNQDKESIFSVVSNIGISALDNLIGTKVVRYDVSFADKYRALIFQYSVNGKPANSLQEFIDKYSSTKASSNKNPEDDVKEYYKKKTHSMVDSLVSRLKKGIDDIFSD